MGLLCEQLCGSSVHHCGDFVAWAVRIARAVPAWIDGKMRAGVPASDRQVDAAAEGHCVIDDHDLLVVHRTGGMHSVDREMHSCRGELVEQTHRRNAEPEPVEGGQEAKVRLQQIDVQFGTLPQQPVQERPEVVGPFQRRLAALECRPVVQIPADDDDSMVGVQHRGLDVPQVVSAVDNGGVAIRRCRAPAGLSRHDQRLMALIHADADRLICAHGHSPPEYFGKLPRGANPPAIFLHAPAHGTVRQTILRPLKAPSACLGFRTEPAWGLESPRSSIGSRIVSPVAVTMS